MKSRYILFSLVLATVSGAFASGFSLYEPSAYGHAMGGALLGKTTDPSANFINPATLTDITNITVTVGFVTEHPRCDVEVDGGRRESLDAGLFWLPHFQLAVPLPYGFAFGLGGSAEYGLGTEYSRMWTMNWNSQKTTVRGYVMNPNLAYQITDDWSVGAGLRWLFFDFEQYSYPLAASGGRTYGSLANRLKGDNDFEDFGWQIGTKYDIFDNLSVGAVYKAQIDTTISGRCTTRVAGYDFSYAGQVAKLYGPQMGTAARNQISSSVDSAAAANNGAAEANLNLPQSITFGCNWDIADDWHLGGAASWTEWSKLDTLNFHLPSGLKPIHLKWHDTWRFSIAPSWDFAEDWSFVTSYVFDMDCTDSHQDSTMLPPADRHILAGGLVWRFSENLEFCLSYSCIFMQGGTMYMNDSLGRDYTLKSTDGFCHAGGFSVTCRF